jgi:hypothetical protein
MHIRYTPEDGNAQRWDFDPGRVRNSTATKIAQQLGGTYDEWKIGVTKNDPKARRVLLWYLTQLDHPNLRLVDVPDFYDDELVVEFSVKELDDMRTRAEKSNMPNLDTFLMALEVERDEAVKREAENPAEGKASLSLSLTDGG